MCALNSSSKSTQKGCSGRNSAAVVSMISLQRGFEVKEQTLVGQIVPNFSTPLSRPRHNN